MKLKDIIYVIINAVIIDTNSQKEYNPCKSYPSSLNYKNIREISSKDNKVRVYV